MSKTIIGLDKLQKKFVNLSDSVAGQYLEDAVKKGILPVRNAARLLAPVNHGPLRNYIRTKTETTSDGVQGIVYNNMKYAGYVEFGTGPAGEENHEGISPNINPKYSQTGWLIPAEEIDIESAFKYRMFPNKRITINGKDYYKTLGQPAQPFMYPALKSTEKVVTKRIGKEIAKKIREEAKK